MSKRTFFNIEVIEQNNILLANLTDFTVFFGLEELTKQLTKTIIDKCVFGTTDVFVQVKTDKELMPQLYNSSIVFINFNARISVAEDFPANYKKLEHKLFSVFSTLEQNKVFNKLLKQNTPLLFTFEDDLIILAEYEKSSKFIRLTMENSKTCRLDFNSLKPEIISLQGNYSKIQGRNYKLKEIFQSIHTACYNGETETFEIPQRQKHLFKHFNLNKLKDLSKIKFLWNESLIEEIIKDKGKTFVPFIIKVFFLLEDVNLLINIANGKTLQIVDGSKKAYVDLSQGGKVLNISIGSKRVIKSLDEYAEKMPNFNSLINNQKGKFKNTSVFLIHHLTSEILAMIGGLDKMECPFLHTLFVKYQGLVPDTFLDSLGSMPAHKFEFHALQQSMSNKLGKPVFSLSDKYSPISKFANLNEALKSSGNNFFEAMKLTAGHFFFLDAIKAEKQKNKLLLIEDGGYLSPEINKMCLQGKCVKQVFEHYKIDTSNVNSNILNITLENWLSRFYIGSVEHTRNGYDRLLDVEKKHKKLSFPATTIAISNLKRGEEARGTSTSIIHAIETVLHGLGKMLCYRNAVVLGAQGAIGKNIINELEMRITNGELTGVDICLSKTIETNKKTKIVPHISQLPDKNLLNCDLFIGITGKNVIEEKLLDKIILQSNKEKIYFASGSTKTVEFETILDKMNALLTSKKPTINNNEVNVKPSTIYDPQTGMSQGIKYKIFVKKQNIKREIYLLASGMPVNFLYYGVPSEMFDFVLSELTKASIWLIKNYEKAEKKLLAVDKEIKV